MTVSDHQRVLAAAAAAGLALLFTGCGGDNGANAPGTTSSPATTSAATTSVEQLPVTEQVAPIPAAQAALRTASGAVADGQPFEAEVEKSGDQLQFEVEVASNGTQHKVVVDSTGSRVVSQEQSDKPDDDMDKLNGIKVSAAEALDAASQQAPDAQFHEIEIDTDDAGAVVWDVELVRPDGTSANFDVDAQSGAVTPKK